MARGIPVYTDDSIRFNDNNFVQIFERVSLALALARAREPDEIARDRQKPFARNAYATIFDPRADSSPRAATRSVISRLKVEFMEGRSRGRYRERTLPRIDKQSSREIYEARNICRDDVVVRHASIASQNVSRSR